MIYFSLVWTGLFLACLTVGCSLLHCLRAERVRRWSDRMILSAWLGLSIVAISLLTVALFLPLTPIVGTVTIFAVILAALQVKSARLELVDWGMHLKKHAWWKAAVLYGLCCTVSALFSSRQILWIDTGIYHYGFIRWFAEYGITPGLALINQRLGFVSAWFALAAPFNPSKLAGSASALMNGFGLLLALLQTVVVLRIWQFSPAKTPADSHFSEAAASEIREIDWFLAVFSLVTVLLLTQTPFLSEVTISASPDPAIALFTVVIAWSIRLIDTSKPSSRLPSRLLSADIIPLVLAIAAVSFKLTALPLLAITMGYYWARQPGLLRAIFVSGFVSVGLLPLLSAQTVTSGCPLYPSTAVCFDLPWTQATYQIQELAAKTHEVETWFGQPPAGANRHLWLFQQWLDTSRASKLIVLLSVFSVIAGPYLLLRFKPQLHDALLWLVALSWVGTAFTLLRAPVFRLGMGSTLLLPMFTAAILCAQVAKRWPFKARKSFSLPLAVASLSLVILLYSFSGDNLGKRAVLPPSLPAIKTNARYVNDIDYVVTKDRMGQCWAASLPCVIETRSDVRLRNPAAGIAGGFILSEGLDASEK